MLSGVPASVAPSSMQECHCGPHAHRGPHTFPDPNACAAEVEPLQRHTADEMDRWSLSHEHGHYDGGSNIRWGIMAPFRTGRAPGHYAMGLPDRMPKLNEPRARHRSSARSAELRGRACYGRFSRWILCCARAAPRWRSSRSSPTPGSWIGFWDISRVQPAQPEIPSSRARPRRLRFTSHDPSRHHRRLPRSSKIPVCPSIRSRPRQRPIAAVQPRAINRFPTHKAGLPGRTPTQRPRLPGN